MMRQKKTPPLGDDELEALIRQAGKRAGFLPPETVEELAVSVSDTTQVSSGPVPAWVQDPAFFARLLAHGPTRRTETASSIVESIHEELAMAARAASGKLSREVQEKMRTDRSAAKTAAQLRRPKRDGS